MNMDISLNIGATNKIFERQVQNIQKEGSVSQIFD